MCVACSKKSFQIRCIGLHASSTFVALTPYTDNTFLNFASFYLGPHLDGDLVLY